MIFLPTNTEEAGLRGWKELDIIFVTGDAYVDHPAFGVPLLARLLESRGFRVGILAQPDWRARESFMALGRPRLFFAVSAGAMDSMVAHYTPGRKIRRDDAYTPGNRHGARPNRATIVYTSRLKEAYRDVPVIIGGIEASLRRLAHYDYWDDAVRRSVLFDSKADLLVFGMGERPLVDLAERIRRGEGIGSLRDIAGTAYASADIPDKDFVRLPSFEMVAAEPKAFAEAYRSYSLELTKADPGKVIQQHGHRFLICNPPAAPLRPSELDQLYRLPFVKAPHPSYGEQIPAFEQIRSSITTHRGCFGGCAFCAIAHHQGRTVQSRTVGSIVEEVEKLVRQPWFRGTVSDLGGPTANMYGARCGDSAAAAGCRRQSCLYPAVCANLKIQERAAADMLRRVRQIPGVRNAVVSSGIRYDLLALQPSYFRELLGHHVGGLLKIAPEHLSDKVTRVMRKPGHKAFLKFLEAFTAESTRMGKKQHIVPYLVSGHPGCRLTDMVDLALMLKKLRLRVEQVQDFTPTPGTLSTCMYFTGTDPFTGEPVYVPKSEKEKRLQKSLLLFHVPEEKQNILEALRLCGRQNEEIMTAFFGKSAGASRAGQADISKKTGSRGR